jgi:hypothetical protein
MKELFNRLGRVAIKFLVAGLLATVIYLLVSLLPDWVFTAGAAWILISLCFLLGYITRGMFAVNTIEEIRLEAAQAVLRCKSEVEFLESEIAKLRGVRAEAHSVSEGAPGE